MGKETIKIDSGHKLRNKEFKALLETPIPKEKKLLGILRLWIYLRVILRLSTARIKTILVGDLKSGIIRLTKAGKDTVDIRKIMKRMIILFLTLLTLQSWLSNVLIKMC